jgi:glucose-1-phosphate adenylyltransferase
MATPRILAIVLAGGEGKRLMPLTTHRAKPAVPFGGIYRLIDFALSNVINSGYLQVIVLTQYKSHSLDRHIAKTWRMSALLGNYVAPVPAQQRVGKHWYLGSADAIFQCLNIIDDERPDIVVVVGADHVYRMDFSQMVRAHIESGAELTVAAIRQPIALSTEFGVIETDPADPSRIAAFREKPADPVPLADSPGEILASMGNYVVNADALVAAVSADAEDPTSRHDMGGDLVPAFVSRGQAGVYDFIHNDVPGSTDRDEPVFNVYNYEWALHTGYTGLPPAKFVHAGPDRIGYAADSLVSPGVIVSGGGVSGSVLSPGVSLHSWSAVSDSVLMDGVQVHRHAQVHRAILDKNVIVPERARIGLDLQHDLDRGFTVTESGITVVPKGTVVEV